MVVKFKCPFYIAKLEFSSDFLEHSHKLVQKLLSILEYELTFSILHTFQNTHNKNYLFYIIFY